jgi:D-3-phosphoglycerate dehydrogenase
MMSRPEGGPARVVVTDHVFPSLDEERAVLEPLGAVVDEDACGDDLPTCVADADALLVQFARIDADVLAAARRCRVLVRYGIGVDNVDLDAAREVGVPVSNVPDYALEEVADHAMALLLAGFRQLPRVADQVKAGTWELQPFRPLRSLADRTLGLAGFGAIARRVAARARAFGLRVQAYDPYVADDKLAEAGVARADWATLLSASDALSLHLPLTPTTAGLFDEASFAAMRPGMVFVNTSRGGVVREGALLRALDDVTVAFAGLDVLEDEPPPALHPIVMHERALVTSHCAWYSEESLARLQRHAALEVARSLNGEPLAYRVGGAPDPNA